MLTCLQTSYYVKYVVMQKLQIVPTFSIMYQLMKLVVILILSKGSRIKLLEVSSAKLFFSSKEQYIA